MCSTRMGPKVFLGPPGLPFRFHLKWGFRWRIHKQHVVPNFPPSSHSHPTRWSISKIDARRGDFLLPRRSTAFESNYILLLKDSFFLHLFSFSGSITTTADTHRRRLFFPSWAPCRKGHTHVLQAKILLRGFQFEQRIRFVSSSPI